MSASLVYLPVKPETPIYADVVACQVRQSLQKLYGDYPIILNEPCLPALRTLEAVSDYPEGYTTLIRLVEQHAPHGIKLWEEH